jgi:hypothetical protein
MQNNLIDKSLFTNGTEPWPNQVFNKDFDAYFLVSYPQYFLNQNDYNIFDPFDFLNNLSEKNIYISSPNGISNLVFSLNADWNRQLYYDAYQQNIGDERFLFWKSENEKWAMVSDAKYNVAVIGIDWRYADQVPFFFNQCLLSPNQFLEKVALQKHAAIFLKNYKPAAILTVGAPEENPIWQKYYFQCHVDNENDKLFYWPQFEKIFNIFHPALKHCKSLDMYADQALGRRYWMNKQWYGSYKNAPVGGWQKYSNANCNKVANKFLNNNEHLRLAFEGKKAESEAMYIANKKGLIEFFTFWIYASVQKVAQKGGASDFYFQTTLHSFSTKENLYNQVFEFCFNKSLLNEAIVNKIVGELAKIGFALKVHLIEAPYVSATFTEDAPLAISRMYSAVPDLVTDKNLMKVGRV